MHHARAQDFEPTRLLADPTSVAPAREAQHVDLRRGLGERKERRAEADARAGSEHGSRANSSSVPLRSAMDTSRSTARPSTWWNIGEWVMSASRRYTRPRHDDAHGRPLGLHDADLHGRGVRAQEGVGREVERVLHVARRVIGRQVEGLEVVVVRLDLRPLRHREAQAREHGDDLVAHLGERMHARRAAGRRPGRVRSGRSRARWWRRSRSRASARRASSRASSSRLASLAAAPTSGRSSAGSRPRERRSWVSSPCRPRTRTRICSSSAAERAASIAVRASRVTASTRGWVTEVSERRPWRSRPAWRTRRDRWRPALTAPFGSGGSRPS